MRIWNALSIHGNNITSYNVPLNKYERGGTDPLETNIKVQGLKRRFIHDCNSIIK